MSPPEPLPEPTTTSDSPPLGPTEAGQTSAAAALQPAPPRVDQRVAGDGNQVIGDMQGGTAIHTVQGDVHIHTSDFVSQGLGGTVPPESKDRLICIRKIQEVRKIQQHVEIDEPIVTEVISRILYEHVNQITLEGL